MREIRFAVPGRSPDAASQAVIMLPRSYLLEEGRPDARRWPVVYLLHGYGGDCHRLGTMFRQAGRPLEDAAEFFGLILVAADGRRASWYLDAAPDAPEAGDWQYETIVTRHLVPEIDRRLRTWAEPAGRGLTGMSMGGHGAVYLAARHPELFSACSAMAGVFSLTDTTQPRELAARLGSLEEHRDRWIEHSVLTQAGRFRGRPAALFIDCGTEDPFIHNNRAVHRRLIELGVPHDYIERPGGHTTAYWVNAMPYHLRFLADRLKPAGRP